MCVAGPLAVHPQVSHWQQLDLGLLSSICTQQLTAVLIDGGHISRAIIFVGPRNQPIVSQCGGLYSRIIAVIVAPF